MAVAADCIQIEKIREANPILQKLEIAISRERLGRYLSATKGHLANAVKLYELNLRLAQLLYGGLHGFEVLLRNSIHDQLTTYYRNAEWFDKAPLNPSSQDMVAKAKANVLPKLYTPGKVVAELTMGFWTGLTAGSYQRDLWVPCLYKAFPNIRPDRAKIHAALSDLKALRNRVAHHDRIVSSQGKLYAGKHPVMVRSYVSVPSLSSMPQAGSAKIPPFGFGKQHNLMFVSVCWQANQPRVFESNGLSAFAL